MRPHISIILLTYFITGCAVTPATQTRATTTGAHAEVSANQQRWQKRALRDYAFVVEQRSMVRDLMMEKLRVVVIDGRVRAASSLLYGGSARLAFVPTIDVLFDRAERAARLGPNGTPYDFAATYDPEYGVPLHVWSNPRADMADDETGFDVLCFSSDPEGCAPSWTSRDQCAAADGRIVNIPAEQWCGPNSPGSSGLVSADEACCRDWQPDGTDGISADQCAAAGGRIAQCERYEISIGTVHASAKSCCREIIHP